MIGPEAWLALQLSVTDARGELVVQRDQRVRIGPTVATETPLPVDVLPTSLLDLGTGDLPVAANLGDLVGTATRYVQALAVLPVDPEAEARVDALVAPHVGGVSRKRPLRPPR